MIFTLLLVTAPIVDIASSFDSFARSSSFWWGLRTTTIVGKTRSVTGWELMRRPIEDDTWEPLATIPYRCRVMGLKRRDDCAVLYTRSFLGSWSKESGVQEQGRVENYRITDSAYSAESGLLFFTGYQSHTETGLALTTGHMSPHGDDYTAVLLATSDGTIWSMVDSEAGFGYLAVAAYEERCIAYTSASSLREFEKTDNGYQLVGERATSPPSSPPQYDIRMARSHGGLLIYGRRYHEEHDRLYEVMPDGAWLDRLGHNVCGLWSVGEEAAWLKSDGFLHIYGKENSQGLYIGPVEPRRAQRSLSGTLHVMSGDTVLSINALEGVLTATEHEIVVE